MVEGSYSATVCTAQDHYEFVNQDQQNIAGNIKRQSAGPQVVQHSDYALGAMNLIAFVIAAVVSVSKLAGLCVD